MKRGRLNLFFVLIIFLFVILNLSFVLAACGDSIVEDLEECDLGDITNGDGCSSSCQMENGWYCFLDPLICRTHCGDEIVAGGEQCDDGNTLSGDGCNSQCGIETGYLCGSVNTLKSACNDGIDNDDDGSVDMNDVGCTNMYDAVEKEDSIYVALGGSDTNSGTKNSPFRTLEKAKEVARQKISHGLIRDLVIVIRGGEYFLNDVFELDERDSGNNGYFAIWRSYPKEEVKITTAEILDNSRWELYNGSIYRMKFDGRKFYTLLEENKRAYIAQEPDWDPSTLNGGFLLTDGQRMVNLSEYNYDRFRFREGDLNPNHNYTNAKVDIWHADYFINLMNIKDISFEERQIIMEGKAGYIIPFKQPAETAPASGFSNNRYRIFNSLDFLDMPGEFYIEDHSDYLYYWPIDSNFLSKKIYAPREEYVFKIEGTTNDYVKDVQIHDLSFFGTEYIDTVLQSDIYSINQSLLFISKGKNIIVSDSLFENSGLYGILGRETEEVQIKGNTARNNGYQHIYLKGERNVISDNNVSRSGNIRLTSFGVVEGAYKSDAFNVVKSNTIRDSGYGGISITGDGSMASDNEISDFVKRSSDAGGIYMWNSLESMWRDEHIIKHNYIHTYKQLAGFPTRTEAIYQDGAGISGALIYQNLLGTPTSGYAAPLRLRGKHNHVLNNIMVGEDNKERILASEYSYYYPEKNRIAKNIFSFLLNGNSFVYQVSHKYNNTALFQQTHFYSESNLVSSVGTPYVRGYPPASVSWDSWISAGHDKNSIATNNPIFTDAKNKYYTISSSGKTLTDQIGFKEFDMNFGVRPLIEQHGDSICVVKCGYGDLTDTTKCNQINTTTDQNSTSPSGESLIDDSWPDIGINTNTDNIPITEGTINNFIFIQTYSPSENNITMLSGDNRTFSLTLKRDDYERIEWYLNNRLVEHDSLSYYFYSESLYPGNHTLELVIIKGNFQESKMWNVEIIDNYAELEYAFEFNNIITYIMIVIVLLIIILVVFLIVNRRNSYY